MEKALMTVNETSEYLGLGKTKTRELIRDCNWALKIGNKWFINKKKLDQWLDEETEKW